MKKAGWKVWLRPPIIWVSIQLDHKLVTPAVVRLSSAAEEDARSCWFEGGGLLVCLPLPPFLSVLVTLG